MAERCTSTYAGMPCDQQGGHAGNHRHRPRAIWDDASADKPTAQQEEHERRGYCGSQLEVPGGVVGCLRPAGHMGDHGNRLTGNRWDDTAQQARALAAEIESNVPVDAVARLDADEKELLGYVTAAFAAARAGETEKAVDQILRAEGFAYSLRLEMEPPRNTFCVRCGPDVRTDEDGCCSMCGADATGEWAEWAARALREELEAPVDALTWSEDGYWVHVGCGGEVCDGKCHRCERLMPRREELEAGNG